MQLYGSKVIIQCQARLRGTCAETEDATGNTIAIGSNPRPWAEVCLRGTCAETEDATLLSEESGTSNNPFERHLR